MLFSRRSFAKVAFAATALAALAFTTGRSAGADEVGFLAFDVVGQTPMQTILRADVTPMLDNQPLLVRFGPAPNTGNYIGGTTVHTGTNYFAVPNPNENGWYTAECGGARKTVEDTDPGLN